MLIRPPQNAGSSLSMPSLDSIRRIQKKLQANVLATPTCHMPLAGLGCDVWGKMECWQISGSFKFRGALHSLQHLSSEQLKTGVVTASAGNHALAVCHAAQVVPTQVKIVMPSEVDPHRVELCQNLGASVCLVDSFSDIFTCLKELSQKEGRQIIHPFEGPLITEATATIGIEAIDAIGHVDAVVVAVGGGGLMSGVSYAVKTLLPGCQLYGVEPEGAATLSKSFAASQPVALDEIDTIAKSLSAPEALPYSFQVCSEYVDAMVTVSDREIVAAMWSLFNEMSLALEPAAACALAAIKGPLQTELKGKRVLMIVCGSNVNFTEFKGYIE